MTESEPREEKGTQYTVLQGIGSEWSVLGSFVADSKEEAIRALLKNAHNPTDETTYRAVPYSSWKDEFVVETEPRVRRKR